MKTRAFLEIGAALAIYVVFGSSYARGDAPTGGPIRGGFPQWRDELFADISDELFWKQNFIAEAAVSGVEKTPHGQKVTLEIARQFDDGTGLRVNSISSVYVNWVEWRASAPSGHQSAAPAKIGDHVIVFWRRDGSRTTWLEYLDTGRIGRALLRRYVTIGELRQELLESPRLRQAVFDDDRWVAIYCAKRLQKLPLLEQPPEYVEELRRYRDLDTVDGEVRVWVARLTCFLDKQEQPYNEEYTWARRALERSQLADAEQLAPIADDLVLFPDRIDETARFLASLARDRSQRREVRRAAIHPFYRNVFEDWNARKLPVLEEVFDAWEELLCDDDDRLRVAAPRLLLHYCNTAVDDCDAKRLRKHLRHALGAMKTAESKGYKNNVQDAREAIEAFLAENAGEEH